MFRFIPRNENFFELFDMAANNILNGARVLKEMVEEGGTEERVDRMKDLEHEGDRITHDTVKMLNQTFVTPFDREDIHALICGLDDIMDLLDAVGCKYYMYKLKDSPAPVKELAEIIYRSAEETVRAISYLEKLDKTIHHICIELNSLENDADRIVRSAIAGLFDMEKDPFSLIKWKELYETLEETIDRFEDVANILEAIIVKHA